MILPDEPLFMEMVTSFKESLMRDFEMEYIGFGLRWQVETRVRQFNSAWADLQRNMSFLQLQPHTISVEFDPVFTGRINIMVDQRGD